MLLRGKYSIIFKLIISNCNKWAYSIQLNKILKRFLVDNKILKRFLVDMQILRMVVIIA